MKLLRYSLPALIALFLLTGCDDDNDFNPANAGIWVEHLNMNMNDAQLNSTGDVASVQFSVPAITANVNENGAVLAFFKEQGTWTAMPYTFGVETADPDLDAVDYTMTLGYAHDTQFLEVFYESSTAEVSPLDQPDRQLKVVILDDFAASKTGINLRDWKQVRDAFGLKD